MKVDKETALFQTPFGSHLYGTNGPNSDYDFKVVCLPSFDDLLMNKKITNRVQKPEGVGPSGNMIAGEAEYEFIPLQIYLDHFYEGQTYAVEMAFAVQQNLFTPLGVDENETRIRVQALMKGLLENFLTRNVQKMVGYAVAQSRQYGVKTQRYSTLEAVRKKIEDFKVTETNKKLKLADAPQLFALLKVLEHVNDCEIANARGGEEMAPGIDICGKKFPLTTTWDIVLDSISKTLDEYGSRVKNHIDQPADWKALSHAIRITEQINELCLTGFIRFPRPNAAFLIDVKQGRVPLEEAKEHLANAFNKVDASIVTSLLQERTPELDEKFQAAKLGLLRTYYGL